MDFDSFTLSQSGCGGNALLTVWADNGYRQKAVVRILG
jgi:hypothetical protein